MPTALYVNDERIDEAEVNQEAERLRPHYEQVFSEQTPEERDKQLLEWSRENVVERALLRQAAIDDPTEVPAEEIDKAYGELMEQYGGEDAFYEKASIVKEQSGEVRDDLERQLRLNRMLERITGAATDPTDAEIRAVYDGNTERFTQPEMVHAAHIVKHPEEGWEPEAAHKEMKLLLGKILEGVNFEFLAGQNSDCPESGGDLGVFPRGQMVEAFENVVFEMAPGEISDVFETEFGLHIAKVYDKRPAAPVPFEEARETIATELKQQGQQKAVEEFVDAERKKATIEEREAPEAEEPPSDDAQEPSAEETPSEEPPSTD